MKPPAFLPPYDSPIEEEFAREIVKYLRPDVDFVAQNEAITLCGRFVLDFVARVDDRCIGFECDGAAYHEASHDEWRDAMILGDGCVDTIYRLRGSDIHRRLEDCLHLIARRDPSIFSPRGRMNLSTLATPRLRNFTWESWREELTVEWSCPACTSSDESDCDLECVCCESSDPSDALDLVRIGVRDRRALYDAKHSHFWVAAYHFAVMHGGGSIEAVQTALRTNGLGKNT